MATANIFKGTLIANDARIALVVSRFNGFIVDHLRAAAIDTLERHGVSAGAIDIAYAPGAFELPLVAQYLAKKKRYDALIALGAVIRGATPHFDYVAGECARGIARVSLDTGVPIAFGVLTVDTIEQAIERAGTKAGNKGADAALTALEMIGLLRAMESKQSE